MNRTFEDTPAVRKSVPLHIGLVGPSGSGKTYSALRLATGIQSVYGGDIFCVDSEANRALHYAERFKFRHVPFAAPFDPLSYLAAVEHCVKRGAKTIIIDSTSHLHEGQGGTLEAHETECDRLMNQWKTTRDKVQMSAWAKPKTELRRFINDVLQMQVNIIWAFRAKEKIKLIGGKTPQAQGFMPISSEELIYEMSLNMLLYPNSGGVPTWQTEEMGEKAIIKLPAQFHEIFRDRRPLDENIGKALAMWAYGSSGSQPTTRQPDQTTTTTEPSPELLRLTFLQDTLDKWEKDLNPSGVEISRAAIASNDHAKILSCLRSIRPVLEPKGVVFPEVTW